MSLETAAGHWPQTINNFSITAAPEPKEFDDSYSWKTKAWLTAGIALIILGTLGALIAFSLFIALTPLVALAITMPFFIVIPFFTAGGMALINAEWSHNYDLRNRERQMNYKRIKMAKINA